MPEQLARYATHKAMPQPARRARIGDHATGRIDIQVYQGERVGDVDRRIKTREQVGVFARAAQGQRNRFVALVQTGRCFDLNTGRSIGAQLFSNPSAICHPIRGHAAFTYNHTICHRQIISHTEFPNAS
jgi:hypothetical protein